MSTSLSNQHSDVLIVGSSMVGLFIAHQLLVRGIIRSITVLDKASELWRHSSVLHATLHSNQESTQDPCLCGKLPPLRAWVEERQLPRNSCGRVIVPYGTELDPLLDVLAKGGWANGAVFGVMGCGAAQGADH
jgi:L-2-hydroxyglutarate oxidase